MNKKLEITMYSELSKDNEIINNVFVIPKNNYNIEALKQFEELMNKFNN